jgi:hypothetical protein
MASVSGLSARHRAEARRIVLHGCNLLLSHPWDLHYSQGSNRWEGISSQRLIRRGQYPHHGDCSSTNTWLLWNALRVRFGVRDTVNGINWRGGYTGTMLNHGKPVHDLANLKVGDCAIYGWGFPGSHTTLYMGGGMWFSHGSERGPFKVSLYYRPDLMQIRRYI